MKNTINQWLELIDSHETTDRLLKIECKQWFIDQKVKHGNVILEIQNERILNIISKYLI